MCIVGKIQKTQGVLEHSGHFCIGNCSETGLGANDIAREESHLCSSKEQNGPKKVFIGPPFMRVIMGGECSDGLRWVLWLNKSYSAKKIQCMDRFTVFLLWKGPHHTVVLDSSIYLLELVSMNCGERQ